MLLEICKCDGLFQYTVRVRSGSLQKEIVERIGAAPGWFQVSFVLALNDSFSLPLMSLSVTHVLFQLPTISSVLNLLLTMGTTPLVKFPISSTVFCRR